jgi:hypothetical protein
VDLAIVSDRFPLVKASDAFSHAAARSGLKTLVECG